MTAKTLRVSQPRDKDSFVPLRQGIADQGPVGQHLDRDVLSAIAGCGGAVLYSSRLV